jgi:hypothetical protein
MALCVMYDQFLQHMLPIILSNAWWLAVWKTDALSAQWTLKQEAITFAFQEEM